VRFDGPEIGPADVPTCTMGRDDSFIGSHFWMRLSAKDDHLVCRWCGAGLMPIRNSTYRFAPPPFPKTLQTISIEVS
jgi:hypothetical protein